MEYANKVVWTTDISSGIGEALAYEFAIGGTKIVLSGRNVKELERVCHTCTKIGEETFICPLYLSVPSSILQWSYDGHKIVNSKFQTPNSISAQTT